MPKICKTQYRRFTFTPADTADLGSPFVELIINDGTIERGGPDNVDFVESTLATDSYDGKAQTQGYFINTDTRIGGHPEYCRSAMG